MARKNTATLDGLEVGYGTRDTINKQDAIVHTYGRIKEAEIVVDQSNISTFADAQAVNTKVFEMPTGAVILSSQIVVTESFDALTSLVVGVKEADGTTVDPNGLHATILLAALTDGSVDDGAGALVGTELAQDSVLGVTVTGAAPTVGSMVVLVRYREPVPTQDSPAVIQGIVGTL